MTLTILQDLNQPLPARSQIRSGELPVQSIQPQGKRI
jgi:hypothetical protein